jgi:hypothetical protein
VPVRGRYKELALTALAALLRDEEITPFEERVEANSPAS